MKNKLALATACVAALTAGFHPELATATPWKFGVISDTQWLVNNDGKSPASVPAGFIKQINQGFIANGVKLVISVGDSEDLSSGNNEWAIKTRQLFVQDLYNAGIAYYPLRGNHEAGGTNSGGAVSAVTQAYCYPQITNGGSNNVAISNPISSIINGWIFSTTYDGTGNTATVSNTLLSSFQPPVRTNTTPFVIGGNFSYPDYNNAVLNGTNPTGGLTYSVDYNNARFVLLDAYTGTGTTPASNNIALMQPWITQRLSDTNRPLQAFVFGHANIIGGSHKDNLFGAQVNSDSSSNPKDPGDCYGVIATNPVTQAKITFKTNAMDAFIGSLYSNNVHYYIGGHDHHHKHSLIVSPADSSKWVENIISQSDSDKFYTPAAPFTANETSIDEQLYGIGLYIYTVDGPRVTSDYYSVPANLPTPLTVDTIPVTPILTSNWVKQISYGYSLNGKTFAVAQGAPYSIVQDNTTNAVTNSSLYGETGYVGTTLSVLSGTNKSTKTTIDGRHLTKLINTGWAPASGTVSDIATVWGLTDLGAANNDTITVAIKFPTNGITDRNSVVLAARDPKGGEWINAVDYNLVGGTKTNSTAVYSNAPTTLGSYGVDLTNGVAWAVINGPVRDFAVVSTTNLPAKLPWDLNNNGVVDTNDLVTLNTAIRNKSTNPVYDLNNDGKVDVSDTRWLALHYTFTNGTSH